MELSENITLIDVVPADDETWFIIANGSMLAAFREREDAVNVATTMAQAHRPSRLLTRTTDGEIEAITPFMLDRECVASGASILSFPDNDFEMC